MAGSYENVAQGAADEYRFADPTGQFQGGIDNAGQFQQFGQNMLQQDPQAFMNQFNASAAGLSNMVSGQMSPLQQQLNALAADQAQRGAEAAGQAFGDAGALGSGASSRALGTAMATPFAQAQAQLGQQQIGLTGNLWQQSMGQYAQNQNLMNQLGAQMMGQGMQAGNALRGQMGGLVAPQYEYQPGMWDHAKDIMGMAMPIAGLGMQLANMGGGTGLGGGTPDPRGGGGAPGDFSTSWMNPGTWNFTNTSANPGTWQANPAPGRLNWRFGTRDGGQHSLF